MNTDTVHFVCIRAAHHRRGTGEVQLCTHLGCAAFCPAGDAEGHDWMVTSTDITTLRHLGYAVGSAEPPTQGSEAPDRILIRT